MIVRTGALAKTYGTFEALKGVDLAVPERSIYGLIGPNGAGKTTLLAILAGLRRPTAGDVHIGVPPEKVAVLNDQPDFEPWLTGREVVQLAQHLASGDPDRVDEALAECGLADAADRRSGGYSRGMRQRLGLAACLVADPRLLILDEPCAALDPSGRREVLDLIGRLGRDRAVIFSTHLLGDVQEICDHVGLIQHGRMLFQGELEALLARTPVTAFHVALRSPAAPVITACESEPWVVEAREVRPGTVEVTVSDADAAERGLVRVLASAGARVARLEAANMDLERVFLELTA